MVDTSLTARDFATGATKTIPINNDPATSAKQDAGTAAIVAKLSNDPSTGAKQDAGAAAIVAKLSSDPATGAKQDAAAAAIVAKLSADPATGAKQDAIRALLAATLMTSQSPATYADSVGSPFTLGTAWTKVATTSGATRALALGDVTQGAYDSFWTVVPAGSPAPASAVKGLPILAGESFTGRPVPIGVIYARAPSGAVLTVVGAV